MNLKNSSVQKPSNVAMYFSVETTDNIPVPGVAAEMFRIYEDDQLISPFESKQTILNPEVSVVHYTILLMDLSGSITESGTLPTLIEAATLFSERVSKKEQIAIYGFDGGAKLIPVVPLTSSAGEISAGIRRLQSYKVNDPSTNLNGAIVEAVTILNAQMAKATQPLRFGTLVVFTDGTDRAHRVSEEDMIRSIQESELSVFAIGVGGEISAKQLKNISNAGFIQASDHGQIALAFNGIADLIEAASRKFYLLSYCSPSRAGIHDLKVELMHENLSGSLTHQFDASGFGPGCDPSKKPAFTTGKVTVGTTKIPEKKKAVSINGAD